MPPPLSLPESATPSLSASQLARARSRSYALFGRLFLSGLAPEMLPYLQAIPELAVTLPETIDEDEAAADHQHLFGFNIFPFESIFLDPAGLLGGPIAEAVLISYQRAGYVTAAISDNADHVGRELDCLAFICAAESEAWEEDQPSAAERMAVLQEHFLDQHLLRWLPALVLAIRQQNMPFYTSLANLVLDLARSHRSNLMGQAEGEFVLPAPPQLLSDENAGLRDIVAYLLTPAHSGVFLARDDIGRLARRQTLPRGFGGRTQMLQNLWRSAANYDTLELVLQDMGEVIKTWHLAYSDMAEAPVLQPYGKVWMERTNGTLVMLSSMRSRIQSLT